jgi:hypothetical protein
MGVASLNSSCGHLPKLPVAAKDLLMGLFRMMLHPGQEIFSQRA